MSAAEIIEQIKALPPEEQRAVFAFVRIAGQDTPADDSPVRYADDRSFEAVVDRVFEKHAELFEKRAE